MKSALSLILLACVALLTACAGGSTDTRRRKAGSVPNTRRCRENLKETPGHSHVGTYARAPFQYLPRLLLQAPTPLPD